MTYIDTFSLGSRQFSDADYRDVMRVIFNPLAHFPFVLLVPQEKLISIRQDVSPNFRDIVD